MRIYEVFTWPPGEAFNRRFVGLFVAFTNAGAQDEAGRTLETRQSGWVIEARVWDGGRMPDAKCL